MIIKDEKHKKKGGYKKIVYTSPEARLLAVPLVSFRITLVVLVLLVLAMSFIIAFTVAQGVSERLHRGNNRRLKPVKIHDF